MRAEGKTQLRRSRLMAFMLAACCLGLLAGSGTALAAKEKPFKPSKQETAEVFKKLIDCPTSAGEYCTYAETLSGEFKLGSKTAPIEHPLVLQGGLKNLGTIGALEEPLLPPLWGAEEVSKTPQKLPGGLTGIEGIGGEVTATAELVKGGTVTLAPARLFGIGVAVTLPIKIHLQNEELGEECYIGSDTDPVVLHLTDNTTEPPAGTEPIKGKRGTEIGYKDGQIDEFKENTLVDNTFSVPAATGCGPTALLDPIVTAVVNADAGLPSAAGKNVAILNGNVFNALSVDVYKANRKAIKAKEKAAAGS